MRNSTTILLIILALAIGIFYVKPKYEDIGGLKVELAQYEVALNDAKDLKILRDQLLAKYNAIDQRSIDLLKKVVPEKFEPTNLVAVISAVAQRHGVFLDLAEIKEEPRLEERIDEVTGQVIPSSPYKKAQISLIMKGSYQSFYSVLSDLEKHIQIMDLKKLSIKPLRVDDISLGLQFDALFDTYWIK